MHAIPRRTFLTQLGTRAAFAMAAAGCASTREPGGLMPLYIGTYTRDRSRGIYQARMDSETGRVSVEGVVEGVENPSFLALNPSRSHLYAVSEVAEFAGTEGGGVISYAIDSAGALQELNRQPTYGGAPCHLTVDATGRWLLVANYSGGNATVIPIRADGSLGPPADTVQHQGSGPNAQRQEAPHAHNATLDAANRFAFIADLGIDRVVGYDFDAETGRLLPAPQAGVAVTPGAGPRHLDFHPDGLRAYVINELDSTLSALRYDPDSGAMESVASLSTLPEAFAGENSCADVHVHPSGRFVYGSNRGHDSIALFAIDAPEGPLSLLQHQPTLGRTPRNFAIDPSGRFLIAANQDSDSLVTFAIDDSTGRLTPLGDPVEVPVPVCVKFG